MSLWRSPSALDFVLFFSGGLVFTKEINRKSVKNQPVELFVVNLVVTFS